MESFENRKVFGTLGSSNHTDKVRCKNDYYSTDPRAIDFLVREVDLCGNIWECACGDGQISRRLEEYGFDVYSTDLVDRGYGIPNVDFLNCNSIFDGDIVTNPPYSIASDFVLKALDVCTGKVCMFLKLLFLESKSRYLSIFKENPPSYIYVFSKRIACYPNGEVDSKPNSAICYAWFVWDREYTGETVVRWLFDEDLL